MNPPRRPWKLFKLLLSLIVGGAIINIAVAWTISLTIDAREEGPNISMSVSDGSDWWTLWRTGKFGTVRISSMRAIRGPTQMPVRTVSPSKLGEKWFGLTSDMFREGPETIWIANVRGWPSPTLWSEEVHRDHTRVVSGCVVVPLPEFESLTPRVIPLRPLWPGFAINTIFYAAVLWVLFAAPFTLRRWRRIKRGQCASCGYSLRGTPDIDKCPECGATA